MKRIIPDLFSVVIINILVSMIVVLIHYESLYRLTVLIPKIKIKHRYKIVVGVFGALIAHAVEG